MSDNVRAVYGLAPRAGALSTAVRFPHLFSPLRIGPVEARNRIVFGAHFTMFTEPERDLG